MRGDFLPSRAVKVEFFYRTPFDHLMKTLLFGLFAFRHQLLAQTSSAALPSTMSALGQP